MSASLGTPSHRARGAAAAADPSASAAARATETATAAATALLLPGFVDDQGPAFERVAVQCADGVLGAVVVGHRDEPEAARTAGFTIGDDAGLRDLAMGGEHLGELGIGGAPRQIADVDLGAHALTSKSSFPLHSEAKQQQPVRRHRPHRSDPGNANLGALASARKGGARGRNVEHGAIGTEKVKMKMR